MGDDDYREAFAVLVYQLSQKLTQEEAKAIIFIEDLPQNLEEKDSLQVLIQLQMHGKIKNEDPATLERVMRNLNRMDLVSKVREFSKSQKKKKKAVKSKGCNKTMESDMNANLKISMLQIGVLKKQLAYLARRCDQANAVQQINEAIKSLENVERNITCVKQELDRKNSSSSLESSTSVGEEDSLRSLTGHAEELPYPTQEDIKLNCDNNDDEGLYETVPNTHQVPSTAASVSSPYVYAYTAPDVGHPCSPSTSTSVSSAKTRSPKLETPNMNFIARKRTKDLRKPMPTPKPRHSQQSNEDSVDSSVDDCSYTGGTGDSGFVDSRKFRRPEPPFRCQSSMEDQGGTIKLPPTPAPRHHKPNRYAKLNVEEVKISYYKSTRNEHQQYHDMMLEDDTESHKMEESYYQNRK